MEKFRYGKIYIVERTETTLQAFEMTLRGKDFIEIYVREYTPATNELEGFEVLKSGFLTRIIFQQVNTTKVICVFLRKRG